MRIPVALLAILFLLSLGSHAPSVITPAPPPPAVGIVRFETVRAPDAAQVKALGALRWRSGWSIESNDPRFGGISAMHVEAGKVAAFSDAGWLIRFPLPKAHPEARVRIVPLPGMDHVPNKKANRDVEAMAVHGPLAWVILERRNLTLRYWRDGWRINAGTRPAAMDEWRSNYGTEAMLRLPDGRFLVFAEGEGGISEVLMFLGDPAIPGTRAIPMRYRPPQGYRITDAALTGDGRMLLLNRDVSLLKGGFVAKLTVAPIPETQPGALIQGKEIADLTRPLSDNMEALSVTREGGRTILWMASDDNYNSVQRTLLLSFYFEG
jgi:hypothetical protein